MQPGWYQPVRQEFMENECEALPGVAYPGVRDNRSTINTKTGYDDDDVQLSNCCFYLHCCLQPVQLVVRDSARAEFCAESATLRRIWGPVQK